MTELQPSTLDTVFALLSESRRRYLLYHFLENDCANVEGLSQRIAAWEEGASVREIDEEERREVAISLIHRHLPKLAEHGVVDYDARSGDVVTAAEFDDVRPLVEQTKTIERAGEVPEQSPLSALYSKPPEEPYQPDGD